MQYDDEPNSSSDDSEADPLDAVEGPPLDATADPPPCTIGCDEEAAADSLCQCAGNVCAGRPTMRPRCAGAKVFSSQSTACSRALAAKVCQLAKGAAKTPHGFSTTGTPWLYARRLRGAREANETFLAWCRAWISELYGVEPQQLHAARTEPHIVKYDHGQSSKFKFEGIGTHQDGSFATCIMAVSDSAAYSGGGTYFSHLNETVNLERGEVLIFQGQGGPYAAPHRAVPIARGSRVLYLAFFTLKPTGAAKKRRRRRRARRRVLPCEVEM